MIELVSDARAATPTQAVMRLIPSSDELTGQLDHLDQRLRLLVKRHLERHRQRLDTAARSALLRDPGARGQRARETLAGVAGRLGRATTVHARRWRDRAEALGRQLEAINPRRVLKRGYSYTTTAGGELVSSIGDVGVGDGIVTHVSDGSIDSVVGKAGQRAGRTAGKKAGPKADQMDLFGADR